LTTFLSFVFVLGVLVFVHELGHFLAAKRVGIKVLKFQLGFNPTIASFRRGDTEYSIGALPLGGYVKMAGENPEEARTGRADEFLSKSKWERFQVLIMGPVMNLLLAVVLTAAVLYQGAEVPVYQDEPPVVGYVQPGSPADRAGIVPGDLITSVASNSVETWEDLLIAVGTRPNREVAVGIRRNGTDATRLITPVSDPDEQFEIGNIGVFPNAHPRIPVVNPGEPGERAGLKAGDVVLAINGRPVTFQTQLREAIAKSSDKPITLTVRRGEEELDITATPASCTGKTGCPPAGVWIGSQIGEETKSIQPGVFEAISMSVERNVQMAGLIFQTIGDLIQRETSPTQLMGPVAIAQLSGQSAQLGWVPLFGLMASISLNLGLLNLLPIPVLDGGHIAIMALEGVARRDFSMRVKEKMLLAGFVVLMMLMVTVIYNDLTRISWIERLMPWR
jgi:regulator of sigma E protease